MKHEIASLLLEIGAIGFDPGHPVTFKSGIKSPVYIDNRRLPYYPAQWTRVIEGFQKLMTEQGIETDVIAGIEAAGIPHSAALGFALQMPSIFVRKERKEHGMQRRIEGGDVTSKRVLLIEDLVTTGGSSLSGVVALREAGAIVTDCLAIFSYGFASDFETQGVNLHTLTNFDSVWDIARTQLPPETVTTVEAWWAAPYEWEQQSS